MLIKNVTDRGGTWKLRSFWDNDIYKVVSVHKDLPIYKVQPEKSGSKTKTVHRNLLFLCNQLLSEKSPKSYTFLYKRPQSLPTSVNSDSESDSELVLIRRGNIKYNTIDINVEPEPEAEIVDSRTGGNADAAV